MTSVKDHVLLCLKAFDVLLVTLSATQAGVDGDDNAVLDDGQLQVLSPATLNDQVARFKIWAGNIGAHREGRSSLDYRLREASHIRAQIIRLLGDLWDALQDATSILRGERTPWDKEPVPQEEFSGDEEGVEEYVEEAGTTELDQISGDISEVVDCLFRLSVSIRNPAPHDRFKRSMWTDTTGQAHFYIAHVRERFNNADEVLTSRLGRANAHRRQYFRYREQHHEKLAHGIDEASVAAAEDGMTGTIASSIPQQMKIAGLVGEGRQAQDVIDEDKASTGWTATTVASSLVAGDRERPRIPPLPKDAASRPFECPYCYMVISATTTLAWRRHVFADLRPYICLSPDCHTPEDTYTDRHEWMQHMVYHHWRTWTCALGCDECFESATAARNHLAKVHADVSTPEDTESLAGIREGPRSRDAAVDCPLCEESNLTIKEYARHVGRHQKDLSLFTLPPLEDDNDIIDLEQIQSSGESSEDMVGFQDSLPDVIDNAILSQENLREQSSDDTNSTEDYVECTTLGEATVARHQGLWPGLIEGMDKLNELVPNSHHGLGEPRAQTLDDMKQQLALLRREPQTKEVMEKQRELQSNYLREREDQFKAHMGEMRRQQEEAKAELEQATLEAEKAAFDSIKRARAQQAKRNEADIDDDDRRQPPAEQADPRIQMFQDIQDKLQAAEEVRKRVAELEVQARDKFKFPAELESERERTQADDDDDDAVIDTVSQGSVKSSENTEDERDAILGDNSDNGDSKDDLPGSKTIPDSFGNLQARRISLPPRTDVFAQMPMPTLERQGPRPEEWEWEMCKEKILQAYENYGRLSEVQQFMSEQLGFDASTRQYKRRLIRWGKNKPA